MTKINRVAVLKDILEEDKLSDKHSSITFEAKVSITTSNSALENADTIVKISTTSGRGFLSVSFISNNIDFNLFPKDIKVLFEDIEFVDFEYLKVAGFNFTNRNIGNYLILISPL